MKLIDAEKTYNELIDRIDWLRYQDYDMYCHIGDIIYSVIRSLSR